MKNNYISKVFFFWNNLLSLTSVFDKKMPCLNAAVGNLTSTMLGLWSPWLAPQCQIHHLEKKNNTAE